MIFDSVLFKTNVFFCFFLQVTRDYSLLVEEEKKKEISSYGDVRLALYFSSQHNRPTSFII